MEFDPKRNVGGYPLIDPKRNVGWLILLSSKCVGLRVRVYLTVMLEKVFECLANVCISYTEGLDTVYSVREQQLPTTGCIVYDVDPTGVVFPSVWSVRFKVKKRFHFKIGYK